MELKWNKCINFCKRMMREGKMTRARAVNSLKRRAVGESPGEESQGKGTQALRFFRDLACTLLMKTMMRVSPKPVLRIYDSFHLR
jgi:hypothetical protein